MKELIKVMKAAPEPIRIKILKMLEQRVLCVCEVHTVLEIAQSTASKHLKILENAGLVRSYKEGLWVNFTLSNGIQSPYASNLLGNLRHWVNENEDIIDLIAKTKLPEIHREIICRK